MPYISINFGKETRRKLFFSLLCGALALLAIFRWSANGGCGELELYDKPVSESDIVVSASSDNGESETLEQQPPVSEADEAAPSLGGAEEIEDEAVPAYIGTNALIISETLTMPLDKATISSYFGKRTNPVTGRESFHSGLDLAAPKGSKIYAVLDGTVSFAGFANDYGYYIIIDHSDELQTLYAHCSKLLVEEGESVAAGEKIALVGSTGSSTGPHLHIEFRSGGERYDPLPILGDMLT